jgi:large subunit ribosomal protein L4
MARRAALTNKAKESRIVVIEDFQMDSPKTSKYLQFLASLSAGEGTLADMKSILMLNAPKAPEAPEAPVKVKARGRKKSQQAELNKAYNTAMTTFEGELKNYESALEAYENDVVSKYENIALSARNIPNADVINAKDLNVYEVMNADYIILAESAIEQILEVLK